jgi:hypothetical protein
MNAYTPNPAVEAPPNVPEKMGIEGLEGANMLTITLLLVVAAFVAVILHAMGRAVPLWVAVLFLCLVQLMAFLPVR